MREYNIDNPQDKTIILEFEKRFGTMNWREILLKTGIMRKTDAYPDGIINGSRILEMNDLHEKYKALENLDRRRIFMAELEKERKKDLTKE